MLFIQISIEQYGYEIGVFSSYETVILCYRPIVLSVKS